MRRITTANTGLASGGLTPSRSSRSRLCKLGVLCYYSNVVLVDNFMLRNPPERKARNVSTNFRQTVTQTKMSGTIKTKDIKILWARAAGLCSMPDCRRKLTMDNQEEIASL